MKTWSGKILFLATLLTVIPLGRVSIPDVLAAPDPFPIYDSIKANVAFWEKVYARYSTTQCIIHDNRNLSVTYDVIPLKDNKRPGARKTNKKRSKHAKKKYEHILEKLARGAPPSSSEEERVAGLFGPDATPADFRKAVQNIRCQVGQNDRFRQGIIRSGAYLDQIKKIFESYGLPADLAYLPHVESSFNVNAYSKFGAAGMWQFTRSTGKRFLKIGYTLDERRDPIASSRAAARLLKQNYEALKDWPMAITAYNHGLAGMRRAKGSRGTYEAIFKGYKSRLFKFASRNFYSEFLAARHVAKNYRQYFGPLKLDKPLAVHEIALEGYLSAKDLARHFDVDIDVIKALNPSLRAPVYAEQKYIPKGYRLRLPAEAGVTRNSLLAGWPRHLYKPKQKRSLFYRVQRGDTAGEIAETHGIRLSELVLANSLDYRARIYVGQNLRLPAPGEKPKQLAMVKTTTDNDNRSVRSETPGTGQRPKTEPQERSLQKVDTAVSPEKVIADKIPVNPAVLSGNLSVQEVETSNGKPVGTIRVMAEETLGHYSDWLGVATQTIRNLNGYKYGRPLRLSEAVKIPLDKTSKEVFEEKRFEYHKEIEEDFFDAYEIENFEKYKIRSGDSIWTLLIKFEAPLWLIIKYNPDVDFNKLKPMQKIVVPVIVEKETQSDKTNTTPG